ncbi:MAG TPA: NAD-binding protein [Thermoplasmata archaeon]|nr:NAD-binding protein [Thermoplasmata archaeon]
MPGLSSRYFAEIARRIWPFLVLFGAVYVAASVLFFLFDAPTYTLFASFYWGITTLSTVGYGDVIPGNTNGRLVAMAAMFIQIFLLGYLISVITSAVTSEQQKRSLGLLGTEMKGHVVVLGYSAVGRAAVRELLSQEQTVAVVCETPDEVANVRALGPESTLYVTYGPPAERDILLRANVPTAHSVIACTSDDSTNMIACLNVRALAPHVRVVASMTRPELRDTLRTAGVTFVASPADMGGRICAAAAFEPDVADALDDLTQGEIRADMQEYQVTDRTPISRQTFGEAERIIRDASGCILIGYARPNGVGEFVANVNPDPGVRLQPGDAILLIGTVANAHRFHRWYGIDQGR